MEDLRNILATEGVTPEAVDRFRRIIYHHYGEQGRKMDWRESRNPYHIVVSEIMLQQTQVERVILKYRQFISTFPDFVSLAEAPLRNILTAWRGLGYNRRAIALKRIAQLVVREYNGELPDSVETLQSFPGIGPATAGAICAFAFNQPTVFIETNIRRVFIHFFFPEANGIKDREILPLVQRTLDTFQPRTWYFALMDYGSILKKKIPNPNVRSGDYRRQPPFRGSTRQIRSIILYHLLENSAATRGELLGVVGKSPELVEKVINQLLRDQLIVKRGKEFTISS